jgi:hypothetical protein
MKSTQYSSGQEQYLKISNFFLYISLKLAWITLKKRS